jgi:hypothetical protein
VQPGGGGQARRCRCVGIRPPCGPRRRPGRRTPAAPAARSRSAGACAGRLAASRRASPRCRSPTRAGTGRCCSSVTQTATADDADFHAQVPRSSCPVLVR